MAAYLQVAGNSLGRALLTSRPQIPVKDLNELHPGSERIRLGKMSAFLKIVRTSPGRVTKFVGPIGLLDQFLINSSELVCQTSNARKKLPLSPCQLNRFIPGDEFSF